LWCRKYLDISWANWARGLGYCWLPAQREALPAHVEDLWSPDGNAVACLSVRSGFDLLLDALDWAPGDELLFRQSRFPICRASRGLMG
jgi:dTDP-4-amino-4,6-dideoxygalactose transaminase